MNSNLLAICQGFKDCLKDVTGPTSGFSEQGLPAQIVTKLLPVVLSLAGFATVIFIIISGIQFITSSGNPEAATVAKNRLTYALIGFVLIILSFAILQIVDRLFLRSGVV